MKINFQFIATQFVSGICFGSGLIVAAKLGSVLLGWGFC